MSVIDRLRTPLLTPVETASHLQIPERTVGDAAVRRKRS
jgi:hypothetical protein